MDFLSKFGRISNKAALLIVFLAWYLAACVTTLVMQGVAVETAIFDLKVLTSMAIFMGIVFVISRMIHRTDIVDAAWGLVFIVGAIFSFVSSPYSVQFGLNVQTLVTALVTIWGLRLAYIIIGRLRKKPEDKRYVELRKAWKGNEAINSFVRIFMVQAVLAWVIAASVYHVNFALPQTITWLAAAGLVVWAIGFYFEVIGDWQLKKFLADPANKGKIMARGLWRYTRHPNYFGEATMWWGIFLVALSVPNGWIAILSPVAITYLLLFVSGVPLTEKAFEGKPGWEIYKRRVSKFFPALPKK